MLFCNVVFLLCGEFLFLLNSNSYCCSLFSLIDALPTRLHLFLCPCTDIWSYLRNTIPKTSYLGVQLLASYLQTRQTKKQHYKPLAFDFTLYTFWDSPSLVPNSYALDPLTTQWWMKLKGFSWPREWEISDIFHYGPFAYKSS